MVVLKGKAAAGRTSSRSESGKIPAEVVPAAAREEQYPSLEEGADTARNCGGCGRGGVALALPPPCSLHINEPVSPEKRSPVRSHTSRPLSFYSILSPTPESPLIEKKIKEKSQDNSANTTTTTSSSSSSKSSNSNSNSNSCNKPRDRSPSKLLGATLSATLPLRGLNASPGMSIRRKILPHKRKLTRGMTCDTILFRPPPEIVVSGRK
ncbi:hypothetical protein ACOMHN_034271 [Nucella lapillus]